MACDLEFSSFCGDFDDEATLIMWHNDEDNHIHIGCVDCYHYDDAMSDERTTVLYVLEG